MGLTTSNKSIETWKQPHKNLVKEKYNCRVAMWHVPKSRKDARYDTDFSKWFESVNEYGENEIENVERELKVSLTRYKVYTKNQEYDDGSVIEESKYPNGNKVKVNKTPNYVIANIKDKDGKTVAEKCYNFSSDDGRKTIYKHYTQDGDTFTVVRVFSYNTNKNKSTDIINYGYTSQESKLTKGCTLEKEYYLLNGKDVKAEINDNFEYVVKNEQGKKLTFAVE